MNWQSIFLKNLEELIKNNPHHYLQPRHPKGSLQGGQWKSDSGYYDTKEAMLVGEPRSVYRDIGESKHVPGQYGTGTTGSVGAISLSHNQKRVLDHVKNLGEHSDMNELVDELSKNYNIDSDTIRLMMNRVKEDIESGRLKLHMNREFDADSRSFKDVLENGVLKNQFELGLGGTSGGTNEPTKGGIRDYWEKNIFDGIYQDHPEYKNILDGYEFDHTGSASERPLYGYLSDGLGSQWNLEGTYGEVVLQLKPEVSNRTTFTTYNSSAITSGDAKHHGDLFDKNKPFGAVKRYIHKQSGRSDFNQNTKNIIAGNTMRGWQGSGGDYIEAQFHGGVDFKRDILKISFPKGKKYNHMIQLVEKYNLPYERY